MTCILYSAVSAKFVYGNDADVLVAPSEDYKNLVDAISLTLEVVSRLLVSPPLYKLYNNKLSKDFVKSQKVRT